MNGLDICCRSDEAMEVIVVVSRRKFEETLMSGVGRQGSRVANYQGEIWDYSLKG